MVSAVFGPRLDNVGVGSLLLGRGELPTLPESLAAIIEDIDKIRCQIILFCSREEIIYAAANG